MRTVHYGEIAKAVDLAPVGLAYQLGHIRDEICRKRGLPWLNALAVSKKGWRPGESFLPPGMAVGTDEEFMWRGMVLQVFAYDWDNVDFSD